MIAATMNVQHMLWKTGPSATELEQVNHELDAPVAGTARRILRHDS
jgi:hypothetical protein